MATTRLVLCTANAGATGSMSLADLAHLLGRALAEHLDDWAVVQVFGASPMLYRLGQPPHALTATYSLSALQTEVAGLPAPSASVRAIQYIVADAGAYLVSLFAGGLAYDVVTPFVPFAHRINEINAAAAAALPWLKPAVGRLMPVILLPSATTGNAEPFEVFEIPAGWAIPTPPERDACRVRIDPADVAGAATVAWAALAPSLRSGMERWARTVSWRRVGFVVSGGGASVFRLRMFFAMIEGLGVPIDVLAGVSGGTLFSACYAVGGLSRVDDFALGGGLFTCCTAAALASSWVVQAYVDAFLQGCGVNNTEICVLALSTRFPPLQPPRAGIVSEGTFGEAVRASGGAPFFGPYFHHHGRQLDGGLMAVVPPPVLAERFGADVIFAANVMALPRNRFPFEDVAFLGAALGLVYEYTPLGRVADLWNSSTTMVHSLARAYGDQADVFLNTPPNDFTLIEPLEFYRATQFGTLVESDFAGTASACLARWQALP